MVMIKYQLELIGQAVLKRLEGLGKFTLFALAAFGWFFRGSSGHGRWRLLMPQLYQIGTASIPVVGLVGAFVGAVLGIEMFDQFEALGQEAAVGGVINISVVKQIGPVLAAIMIAGRVGGAVTAELGSMNVTEQIDALSVLGADPIQHLVVPRVTACVVMLPILTIFSDLLGIAGGYLVTVVGFGVESTAYWDFTQQFVGSYDIFTGLIKAVFFGLFIGLISCYKGFTTGSGAAGVGKAATEAFVACFIIIIVINLLLAKFLKDLYSILYGTMEINL